MFQRGRETGRPAVFIEHRKTPYKAKDRHLLGISKACLPQRGSLLLAQHLKENPVSIHDIKKRNDRLVSFWPTSKHNDQGAVHFSLQMPRANQKTSKELYSNS